MTTAKLYARRAWLIFAGGIAIGAVLLAWLLPRMRRSAIRSLNEGEPTDRLPTSAELRVVADFTGALVGRRLTPEHLGILEGRLSESARRARRWTSHYIALAAFADRHARDTGFTRFAEASDPARERIVILAMAEHDGSRTAKLTALLTADGRARWRIRYGTAPHLRALYRRSRVPWQLRGYEGAPGAPADPLAYTRPVSSRAASR